MQLNIGICDDEPVMLRKLSELCRKTLEDCYTLQIDCAGSAEELLAKEHPFQIALLDVQLVESSGIELARQILERNFQCRIIFVSGYLYGVSEVYEVPHFCFVLKEQMDQQLPKFLKRAADLSAQDAGRAILLYCGRKIQKVRLADILCLERRGHNTFVKLTDGTVYQIREKLTELQQRIGDAHFFRCHVSYCVNLQHVRSLSDRCFLLESGESVPISRPNETQARKAFFRCLGENMDA